MEADQVDKTNSTLVMSYLYKISSANRKFISDIMKEWKESSIITKRQWNSSHK